MICPTYSTSAMRWAALPKDGMAHQTRNCMTGLSASPEAIDVILHRLRVNLEFLHAMLEEVRIMYTLTTGQDLFAAQEEVARV